MTWVWLNPERADFGLPPAGDDADERTVWVHANPYEMLGLASFAEDDAVRRAYRTLARRYHPDVNDPSPGNAERFHDLQRALAAIEGDLDIVVEPDAGDWWRFAGFSEPDEAAKADHAVVGLTFELTDPARVPLKQISDDMRILCAGQAIALSVSYSGSRFARHVVFARLGALAESVVLALLCVALIPVIAVLLVFDVWVISDANGLVVWAAVLLTLLLGYGALALALTAAGKPLPNPRRAVFRTRTAAATLRALSKGRP
jgi:hypothetical protein